MTGLRLKSVLIGLSASLAIAGAAAAKPVLLPVPADPTISLRIAFTAGAQDDPAGKEGLAYLTATMMSEGATRTHTYPEILRLLYPMAAG